MSSWPITAICLGFLIWTLGIITWFVSQGSYEKSDKALSSDHVRNGVSP